MTPADIAKMLRSKECPGEPHGNKVGMFDGLAQDECWMCIADAIAAALRERDARWLAAVLKMKRGYQDESVDCSWTMTGQEPWPGSIPPFTECRCAACDDLRALLEEAGK